MPGRNRNRRRNHNHSAIIMAFILGLSGLYWAPGVPAATLYDDMLAKADPAYGEYISGECVTCHNQHGGEDGIPDIVGLEVDTFITVMLAYRNKDIDHDAMQLVAGRLDDEQIASLAVYFSALLGKN